MGITGAYLKREGKMYYFDFLRNIYYNGSDYSPRGIKTKEIVNATLDIMDDNVFAVKDVRPIEKVKDYLFGEMAWYFSGSNKSKDICKYSKFWDKIKNDDGTVNSNYGRLVFYDRGIKTHKTPFRYCLNCLKNDPNSRQAIILYNGYEYFYEGNKDFICTQMQHFLLRDNKLHCIVYVRSSDAILGLSYDIPWWSIVQQSLAMALGVETGAITVNIGSAHIYYDKLELVADMLYGYREKYKLSLIKAVPLGKGFDFYENNIGDYLKLEKTYG